MRGYGDKAASWVKIIPVSNNQRRGNDCVGDNVVDMLQEYSGWKFKVPRGNCQAAGNGRENELRIVGT